MMSRPPSDSNDLYGYRRRLKAWLKKVRPILREYVLYLKTVEGLGESRQLKHLQNVLRFERKYLGKKLEHVKFSEFKKAVYKLLENDGLDNDTKYVYRVSFKKFFQFLLSEYEKDKRRKVWRRNLDFLEKIKIKQTAPRIEVLSENEFRKLYENAEDFQTRAIISIMYEAGLRAGELLSLRVKDVVIHENHIELNVYGKTGEGTVIIIKAYRDLANHLENHPLHDNPNAPLWFYIVKNKIKPLTYDALRMRLKRLAKKAGIKRRIWPHLFRHSAATEKAQYLTDREMCTYFRWSKTSRMPARYAHLAQRDIRRKLLSLYSENEFQISKPKTSRCWKCGEILPSENIRYCPKCGVPLQANKIYEMIMKRKEADDLMDRLMSDPRVRKVISEVLYEMIYSETVEGFASCQEVLEPNKGDNLSGKSGGNFGGRSDT